MRKGKESRTLVFLEPLTQMRSPNPSIRVPIKKSHNYGNGFGTTGGAGARNTGAPNV